MHEVSDFVVSMEGVVLGKFERKKVRAKVLTQHINEHHFRIVMVPPCWSYAKYRFVSEDTLTSVGQDETEFLAVRNKTATENVRKELTAFLLKPASVKTRSETFALPSAQVNQVQVALNDTKSEFSSLRKTNFSSTEKSEVGLLENKIRRRTDPQ